MDIQEEREAFQKFCEENFDFENHEQTYFDEQTQCYENDIGEDTESINMAWEAWQAAKAQAVLEWISVKNKLPKIGVYVMVFLEKQGHNPTTYNFCQYTKFGFHLSNVTHWMPLPDAPQEPAND